MRTTRAYIAGLGTSGALLAAAMAAFVLLSALVAFNSWPGGSIGGSTETVDVGSQAAGLRVVSAADAASATLASAPSAVAAGPLVAAAGVADSAPRAGRPEGAPDVRLRGSAEGPVPVAETQRQPTARDCLQNRGAALSCSGDIAVPSGSADEVIGTLGNAGLLLTDTLNRLSPGAGDTVRDTGRQLSEVIRGVPGGEGAADTVSGATGGGSILP